MEVLLQRQLCWPEQVTRINLKKSSNQIKLVSEECLETCVPVQLLAAFSPFLNSILASSCDSLATTCIYIPSATDSTLQLLAQILLTGQTGAEEGFERTMINMKELQGVLSLLGLNVKLCPKLVPHKLYKKAVFPKCASVVKDEACGENELVQYKKPSVFKSRSSKVLKEFKADLKRRLLASKDEHTDICEEVEDNIDNMLVSEQPAEITSIAVSDERVEFKQLGLMRDFKVNLINCASDVNISEEPKKLSKAKENVCYVCGGEFSTFASLRRHYCEQHGLKEETFEKSPMKKCPKCKLMFKSKGALLRHIKWIHKKLNPTERDQSKDVKVGSKEVRYYECPECCKMYSHPKSLRRHLSKEHVDLDLIVDYTQRNDFANYNQDSGHGEDILQQDFCSQNVYFQPNNSARGEDKIEQDISDLDEGILQQDFSQQNDGSFQKDTSIQVEHCYEASTQDEYVLQIGTSTQDEDTSAPCQHCGLVLTSVQSMVQHKQDVHSDATDE